MKTTTITNPDGTKTVIKTEKRGGCGGCLTIIALLFVLGAPAAYFPTFWATVAYIVMGILAVLFVIGWITNKTKEAS